jgi:hypothetical protein
MKQSSQPTAIETAKGERLLITTHINQSNNLANQEQVLGFVVPFASLSSIMCKIVGPSPFC